MSLKHAKFWAVTSGIASILFISFSLIALALTYGPIIRVEVSYQYQKFLSQTFHVRSLRELIVPKIKFDYQGNSTHKQSGVVIPAIFLDEPVVPNIDPNDQAAYMAALKQGIAHAAGTALPGDKGVGYYFAHSSQPALKQQYNAVFYLLGKLEKGDQIFLWKDGVKYEYQVVDKHVTTPDDLSFLESSPDNEKIVLQTCWPPGTTAQRLLVTAVKK